MVCETRRVEVAGFAGLLVAEGGPRAVGGRFGLQDLNIARKPFGKKPSFTFG